jgi:hypothetical protein
MKRLIHWGAILTLGGLLGVQFLAVSVYQRDQRFLRTLLDRIASPNLPPSEQTKRILGYFYERPDTENNGYLFLPIFRFLRPTPRQIADAGGWCSDRSRLMVVFLNLRGIHAARWALFSPRLVPRHAVVEVDTEQGKMVADPLFGLWFPRTAGGYYGIEDLRTHPEILKNRIDELVAEKADVGSQPITQYPADSYVYSYARTINWEKNHATEAVYRGLHFAIGDRADQIPRPGWTEQPALIVAYGIIPIEFFVLAVILRSNSSRKKKQEHKDPGRTARAENRTRNLSPVEEYPTTRHEIG